MLDIKEAIKVAKESYPTGKIQKVVEYKGLYVFLIFDDDPLEGKMDPYYSVDKKTGEFKEFSLFLHGDMEELTKLFLRKGL